MSLESESSLVVQLVRNSRMKISLLELTIACGVLESKLRFARQVSRANLVSSGRFGRCSILLMLSSTTLPNRG